MKRREFIAGLVGATAPAAAAFGLRQTHARQNHVRALQLQILHLQAAGAAYAIGMFIREIEIGWIAQFSSASANAAVPGRSILNFSTTVEIRAGSCACARRWARASGEAAEDLHIQPCGGRWRV